MINIVREWETTRWRLQELEEERRNLVHDQEKQNEQFMEMLTKFGEEVRKVEDLEKKVTQRQMKLQPKSISATAVLERPNENLI